MLKPITDALVSGKFLIPVPACPDYYYFKRLNGTYYPIKIEETIPYDLLPKECKLSFEDIDNIKKLSALPIRGVLVYDS